MASWFRETENSLANGYYQYMNGTLEELPRDVLVQICHIKDLRCGMECAHQIWMLVSWAKTTYKTGIFEKWVK